MKLTKQDYIKFASLFKENTHEFSKNFLDEFIKLLEENPNFNKEKFQDYIYGKIE